MITLLEYCLSLVLSQPVVLMYHLIYRSQAVAPLDPLQLGQLLKQARAFNQRHGLTGVLLYSRDHEFLQVLEGEEGTVRALFYEHIVHDPRHRDCLVLAEGPWWLDRSFADWHMGLLTPNVLAALPPPGVVALSRLALLRLLVDGAHPGLDRLLTDFVQQHAPMG